MHQVRSIGRELEGDQPAEGVPDDGHRPWRCLESSAECSGLSGDAEARTRRYRKELNGQQTVGRTQRCRVPLPRVMRAGEAMNQHQGRGPWVAVGSDSHAAMLSHRPCGMTSVGDIAHRY